MESQTWAPALPTELSRPLIQTQPETHFDLFVSTGRMLTMVHIETLRSQYVLGLLYLQTNQNVSRAGFVSVVLIAQLVERGPVFGYPPVNGVMNRSLFQIQPETHFSI